ncbi:MAG: ABC transporter permease [Proteobacteria bacterium]|nr:ABC transporter permease [Pseudomonadota bacterium]
MSSIAFFGAIEIGLIYGIVAFGVFITYRMLDFPDLSVESTFPLGGAIAAALVLSGWDPWTATAIAFIGGGIAGMLTAFLSVHCGILNLLAGILTMIAGYSINIRIMGRPNISLLGEANFFAPFTDSGISSFYAQPLVIGVICLLLMALLVWFLLSEVGLALRATGQNPRMLRAQGGNTVAYVYCGVIVSNALVALGGALFTHANGFADVTSGIGTIVFGLAAVILGKTILPGEKIWVMLLACLVGAVLYRLFVALILSSGVFGFYASDLNLMTALLVILALVAPTLRRRWKQRQAAA